MSPEVIFDFNFYDFLSLFVVGLLTLAVMVYLSYWLLRQKRNRSFLLIVWILYGLIVLTGGATSLHTVQKERKYWLRYYTDIARGFALDVQYLGHEKIEFSYSSWSYPIAIGEREPRSKYQTETPLHSDRPLETPINLQAKLCGKNLVQLRWETAPEANAYEIQRTFDISDPDSWIYVYRGDEPEFQDDISREAILEELGKENVPHPFPTKAEFYYRVRGIYTTPEDDPTFHALSEMMKEAARKSSLAKIFYTMRDYDAKEVVFIVSPAVDMNNDGVIDPETERASPTGEPYEKTPIIADLFSRKNPEKTGAVNTIPDHDDWGSWVTAMETIYRSDGNIDGVVGVDFPAEQWTQSIQGAQLRLVGFLLFVFALYVIGIVLIARLQCVQESQTASNEKLKKTLEELVIAKENADVAVRAKGHFLTNMSHEIRTPMNAILGFVDILGRRLLECCDKDQYEENKQTIRLIERSGSDLLTIIGDILDFSKVDSEEVELDWSSTDPRKIIEEVRQQVLAQLDDKPGLDFHVELLGMVPLRILTDPHRLRQILGNLCGNAVKFSEVGEILLRCQFSEVSNTVANRKNIRERFGSSVSFGAHADSPNIELLQFVVKDHGIGMDENQMQKLFQPFSQADSSLTRRYGGAGLGLSISKRLAALLGGDISVKSRPGEGSEFVLTIAPKILEQHTSSIFNETLIVPTNATRPLQDRRVLLVEDGKINQIVISTQLKDAGALVTLAENGQIALDLIAAESEDAFDVVLMDMQMPVLDGYEATARLRAQGFERPIIAVTAHALSGDVEKTLSVGCNAYLSKPIDRDRLVELILRLIRKHQKVSRTIT